MNVFPFVCINKQQGKEGSLKSFFKLNLYLVIYIPIYLFNYKIKSQGYFNQIDIKNFGYPGQGSESKVVSTTQPF